MDRVGAFVHVGLFEPVDGVAHHVQQASLDLFADGHRDRVQVGDGLHAAVQSVGGVHRHRAHRVFPDMLLHLDDQLAAVVADDGHRVVDARQGHFVFGAFEIDVHHRSDDLRDAARYLFGLTNARCSFRFHMLKM